MNIEIVTAWRRNGTRAAQQFHVGCGANPCFQGCCKDRCSAVRRRAACGGRSPPSAVIRSIWNIALLSPIVGSRGKRQDCRMAKGRTQSTTPDLFSTASTRERVPSSNLPVSSSPPTHTAKKAPSQRYVLPRDLPGAMKQLDDQELDRLLAAVLAEQRRRGRKPPESDESSRKRRIEPDVSLTLGKLNAVRAAFKAGVKPSQIARQFGISQSDVRKVLARDAST